MNRFYFFSADKYRKDHRAIGVLNFKLTALYEEKVFSSKRGKEESNFSYFDTVNTFVSTQTTGLYRFKVATGKDLATGLSVKSKKELLNYMADTGYQLISEKNYLRLRKLAIKMLFRHSNFDKITEGENRYIWNNQTYHGFWDIKMASFNYLYNRREHDQKMINYLNGLNLPANDIGITEYIRLHISKPKKGERLFKCYSFEIEANSNLKTNGLYGTFEEGFKRLEGDNYPVEITESQYDRVRKICKYLMFEYSELDISYLKKKQDYSVRVLDL